MRGDGLGALVDPQREPHGRARDRRGPHDGHAWRRLVEGAEGRRVLYHGAVARLPACSSPRGSVRGAEVGTNRAVHLETC